MNDFLIYILKSTISISLLYLGFRMLMRKETFFKLNRALLLSAVVCSAIIPLLYLPQFVQPTIQNEWMPRLQNQEIMLPPQYPLEESTQTVTVPTEQTKTIIREEFPWIKLLQTVYLAGILITLLILIHGIVSILILFWKAQFRQMDGFRLLIIEHEISPFSFGRFVIISQSDYDAHQQAILVHEEAHIRLNHFFDLALLETIKILHWFNPVIYWLIRDMKEIHEFQADEYTLNKGIDATQYQILIIQKSVGPQRFALANSFNHCQIKKRIIMMNKQKTSKARRWKVATFLPLLALLLMAFGKPGELVSDKNTSKNEVISSSTVQLQQSQNDRVIAIKSDGNYIGGKLCSLGEIENTVKNWANSSNEWIQIQAKETTLNTRIDEILEKLGGNAAQYHITILLDDSKTIYPAGDVSSMAKFRENWNKWLRNQLSQYSEGKSDQLDFSIKYRFIIDKAGKVTGARIVKKSQSTGINTAMEKVLSQIPDWTPAKRGNQEVSVLYDEIWVKKAKNSNIRMQIPPPPPIENQGTKESKDLSHSPSHTNGSENIISEMMPTPEPRPKIQTNDSILLIDFRQDGNYINDQSYSRDDFTRKVKEWKNAGKSIRFVSPAFELSESRNIELSAISNATGIPFVPNLGVDKQAVFPGGTSGMFAWIKKNVKYPIHNAAFNWSKNTTVEFTVNAQGKAVDAKIAEANSPEFNREAIRIIDQMPLWKPAIKNGVPVNVVRRVSIPFK